MKSSLSVAACAILLASAGLQVTASAQSVVKTGKERLGQKATDEQRVDNC